MSKQAITPENKENTFDQDFDQALQHSGQDNEEKAYEDTESLKRLIDVNPKPSILCKSKENNPNYLSIVYANRAFYDMFGISEANLIGKSYDFLFDDMDFGYSSDNQLEYIRLVKDVKKLQSCSVICELRDYKPEKSKAKFKIDFSPVEIAKYYSTFVLEKIDSSHQENAAKSKTKDVGLLKNLERALYNERLLREVSYLIVSDMPLQEIAQNIAKSICQHLKVDRCLIHDFRHGSTSFVAEYCDSHSKPMFGGGRDQVRLKMLTKYINFQNRFHKKVLGPDSKFSLIDIEDVNEDQNFLEIKDVCKEFSITSQISVATSFNHKINGALYLHQSDKRTWNVDEIELLNMVSDQLSLAIDRSDSIERVMIANHELLEKTQQLKEALKEEKNMRKMQSEFVALVSHEFKTPLQIIDSTRELLVRKIKTHKIVDAAVDKSLDRIKSGIQRMNGLIHSTLNLAKMESGNSKIELDRGVFNLKAFIIDIVEKNSNLAMNKNIKVELKIDDLPSEFNGDAKLLDHSITNIISNAIKYSPNESTVKILAKTGVKKILIKTIDQGIGIPEDDLKNVGQKFFRAKNSLAVAGTGIGLYLTKYFVELHGGTVLIDSKVNVGTSVSVVLPIVPVST